jgi:hypothetical protein
MHRTIRLALPAAAAAVLAWFPFASAAQEPAAQEPAAGKGEEGPLHEPMEALDRGMKALRRTVQDPQKAAENIVRLREMQAAAVESFAHCPEPFQPLSEQEQVLWRIGYQRKILAVADGLLELELALVEQRFEEGREIYTRLTGLKKEGHDTYTPPEEE